jgi:hypothetical protein
MDSNIVLFVLPAAFVTVVAISQILGWPKQLMAHQRALAKIVARGNVEDIRSAVWALRDINDNLRLVHRAIVATMTDEQRERFSAHVPHISSTAAICSETSAQIGDLGISFDLTGDLECPACKAKVGNLHDGLCIACARGGSKPH